MKFIDGNKAQPKENEKTFTSGIGLYSNGNDFDIMIDGEVVIWFKKDGLVRYSSQALREAGFKNPEVI